MKFYIHFIALYIKSVKNYYFMPLKMHLIFEFLLQMIQK